MNGDYKVLQVLGGLLHYAEVTVSDDPAVQAEFIHPIELDPALEGLNKFMEETAGQFRLHVVSIRYSLVDTLPEDIVLAAYMACKNYELKKRQT